MTVQIQKAQAYALLVHGLVIEDRDMYLEMWPNRSWITARQNFVNLKTGRTKSTKPEWLIIIADKTKAPISLIIGERDIMKLDSKEKEYLEEIMTSKFNSELCREKEAAQIISILQFSHINTTRLELDFELKHESKFELLK